MNEIYTSVEPTRAEVNALPGPTVIQFGAPWCGYCQAAQPAIASAFSIHQNLRHIKVEDGKGRPLGRSFRVTLWPTLIFMKDGVEIARLVRSNDANEIRTALAKILSE